MKVNCLILVSFPSRVNAGRRLYYSLFIKMTSQSNDFLSALPLHKKSIFLPKQGAKVLKNKPTFSASALALCQHWRCKWGRIQPRWSHPHFQMHKSNTGHIQPSNIASPCGHHTAWWSRTQTVQAVQTAWESSRVALHEYACHQPELWCFSLWDRQLSP